MYSILVFENVYLATSSFEPGSIFMLTFQLGGSWGLDFSAHSNPASFLVFSPRLWANVFLMHPFTEREGPSKPFNGPGVDKKSSSTSLPHMA